MGFYESQVLSRAMPLLMGSPGMGRKRAQTCAGLRGVVLELGFGAGLNLPHYPDAVERVVAVDPDVLGRTLARDRIAAFGREVRFVEPGVLPLDDHSIDSALATWTLCTIPDLQSALAEVRRVLRPGAALHFLEHGLHPEPSVQRWQHRLEPVHQCYAGGCHLTRDPIVELEQAGFVVEASSWLMKPGIRVLTWMTAGRAIPRG